MKETEILDNKMEELLSTIHSEYEIECAKESHMQQGKLIIEF